MFTNSIAAEYDRWFRAFEKLWTFSRSEAGESLFLGATILRLMYLMVIYWRKAVAKGGATFCATAVQEPKEIVRIHSHTYLSFSLIRAEGHEIVSELITIPMIVCYKSRMAPKLSTLSGLFGRH
jgi:hypothetical protein